MSDAKVSRRDFVVNAAKLVGGLVVATPVAQTFAKTAGIPTPFTRKPSSTSGIPCDDAYFQPGYFGTGVYGDYKGPGFHYTADGKGYFQPGYFGLGQYGDYNGSGLFLGTKKTGYNFQPGYFGMGYYSAGFYGSDNAGNGYYGTGYYGAGGFPRQMGFHWCNT